MRLSLLSSLLFSTSLFAQINIGNGVAPCDENTDYGTGVDIECASLHINGPLTNPLGTSAITIRVVGDVLIENGGDFNLNGDPGIAATTLSGNSTGGAPGPGGGAGGGIQLFTPMNAEDSAFPLSTSNGATASFSASTCAGGGGGGFGAAGEVGTQCGAPAGNGGTPGSIVVSSEFGFTGSFRGGFGGGAGGEGAGEFGFGGGGGGAIHIVAGGDVVIDVDITANGGQGGDTATSNTGGGGGAGSGGAIWIQSLGNITIAGTLAADGGRNLNQVNADGVGGDGGNGFVRLEDDDGVMTETGSVPVYTQRISLNGTPNSTARSLKSDIACGTVGEKDQNLFAQLSFGFALAIFFGKIFKTLCPSRKRFSKTTVHLS